MTYVRLFRFTSAFLLALGIALAGTPAQAQVAEIEPNSACLSAQNLGTPTFPVTVTGSLATPPTTPDVDYYRIAATPGDLIQIEHRGASSGNGTLSDPLLGVFSSACGLLTYNDDGAGNLDSHVEITVPADGVLVIAASSIWDWEFSGNGSYAGSYTLKIGKVTLAQGLGGRIVDANTGAALPNATVWLQSCDNGTCLRYAGYDFAGPDGIFRFEPGNFTLYDNQLRAGEYRLIVNAGQSYVQYEGTPFQLLQGQDLDLGNLGVQPIPVVGSIRGRLVDAVTGAALPGDVAPFGRAQLQTCAPLYGCWTVRYADADALGNFVFESNLNYPLQPGSYRVVSSADQYQETTGTEFEVAADQHYDLGDFAVKSFPVRLNLIQACNSVPSTGGDCPFVVRVTNGNPGKLSGDVWTLVRSLPYYWNGQSTEFQAGRKTVSLQPGTSTDLSFTFTVPASLQDGTAICSRVFTSHKTNPFETIGERDLFCIAKVGQTFRQLPDKEKRELLKKAHNK